MNVFVMSLYTLLLLGNAPSYASEACASFEQKAFVEKEMQQWLKEHYLQQYFTEQNIIVRLQGDSHSRILLRVPEEIWNKRQHILLQSKPSFRTYIIAGVAIGSSAGGALGFLAQLDPTQPNKSRGEQVEPGIFGMLLGGTVGVILGMGRYTEQYSNFEAASSEITRATDLERSYCMPNVSVLLELNGLRNLLSHHRIPDIESVIMSSRKQD